MGKKEVGSSVLKLFSKFLSNDVVLSRFNFWAHMYARGITNYYYKFINYTRDTSTFRNKIGKIVGLSNILKKQYLINNYVSVTSSYTFKYGKYNQLIPPSVPFFLSTYKFHFLFN